MSDARAASITLSDDNGATYRVGVEDYLILHTLHALDAGSVVSSAEAWSDASAYVQWEANDDVLIELNLGTAFPMVEQKFVSTNQIASGSLDDNTYKSFLKEPDGTIDKLRLTASTSGEYVLLGIAS